MHATYREHIVFKRDTYSPYVIKLSDPYIVPGMSRLMVPVCRFIARGLWCGRKPGKRRSGLWCGITEA